MRNPILILGAAFALFLATAAGAYEVGEVPLDKLGKARGGGEVRLSESAGKYGWLSKKFEVPGIPYMLIIDVDGTIEYKHVGYSESALSGIVDEINSLLVRNGLAGQP